MTRHRKCPRTRTAEARYVFLSLSRCLGERADRAGVREPPEARASPASLSLHHADRAPQTKEALVKETFAKMADG